MTVTWVPGQTGNYVCLSSDLETSGSSTSGSTNHIRFKGSLVYVTDTQATYVVNDDLSLSSYVMPTGSVTVTSSGSTTVSGSVSILGTSVVSGSVSLASGSIITVQGNPTMYPVKSGGMVVLSSASFVCGSGSTVAYSINDIVSAGSPTQMLTFAGMGRVNGGTGLIHKARIITSASADVSTYGIHLFRYSSASATIAADNSPYQYLWTSGSAGHVGKIVVGPMATEALGSNAAEAITGIGSTGFPIAYSCASNDTALYGTLEIASALTSASPTYNIELLAIQD
jgi:hypothetical protein